MDVGVFEELAAVPRVGAKRAGEFGEKFLAVIAEHSRSRASEGG